MKANSSAFWKGKKVFITGHTGFKGSWLCLWLELLGANITGYGLQPPTFPSMFNICKINTHVKSIIADIRDSVLLQKEMMQAQPDIVIHMAAQSLVRDSYKNPVENYATNVMGTVNLFEAVRKCQSIRAVLNVTTDKCYENKEWVWGYREGESLGGYDPYSSSKACSELVTASYRSSYFNPPEYNRHDVGIATARAGNVIGGGDWATDRLIPDCIKALMEKRIISIRNPNAIRPWQHVLEPLGGYLTLSQALYQDGSKYSEAWNFGPNDDDAKPVEWIVGRLIEKWGLGCSYELDESPHPHEANYLKLDCSKAKTKLGWSPKWDLETALDKIVEWTQAYQENQDMRDVYLRQIEDYMKIEEGSND